MRKQREVPDLIGSRYGRLVIIRYNGLQRGNRTWLCQCDCGGIVVVKYASLNEGKTQSCGCLQRERAGDTSRKHGMPKGKFYRHWLHMRERCFNPNDKRYAGYGGRGITVCERWADSFENFREDMEESYEEHLSLDRIDVNGGYTKDNCEWVTLDDQSRNKRKNRKNTSGLTGVSLFKGKYPSWVAQWYVDGKQEVRSFSISKYGEEMAKNLAYAYRQLMIEQLIEGGVRYGNSHGL